MSSQSGYAPLVSQGGFELLVDTCSADPTAIRRQASPDFEEPEPDATERPPGSALSEAVSGADENAQHMIWLAPLALFLGAMLLQSACLHAASHSYVRGVTAAAGEDGALLEKDAGELYGPLSFAASGLRENFATGPVAAGQRLLVLVLAGAVPLAWLVLVGLTRNVRLWGRTLAVAAVLALLNGVSTWLTVVPRPLGWSGCRERLHAWPLGYFQGDAQLLQSVPLVLWLWLQDVLLNMRRQELLVCASGPVGSSFLQVLLSLSLFDALRAGTRKLGAGPRLACRATAAVVLTLLALADLQQELAGQHQYSSAAALALVLPLLLYSSPEAALATDYFLKWAVGMVTEEGGDRGDVLVPPCCLPFCCLAGRYYLYSSPSSEVEDLLRGKAETEKVLESLRKDQEEAVWRLLELEVQLDYVRQRTQVRERHDASEAEWNLSERLLSQRKAHEKKMAKVLADMEVVPEEESRPVWFRSLLPAADASDGPRPLSAAAAGPAAQPCPQQFPPSPDGASPVQPRSSNSTPLAWEGTPPQPLPPGGRLAVPPSWGGAANSFPTIAGSARRDALRIQSSSSTPQLLRVGDAVRAEDAAKAEEEAGATASLGSGDCAAVVE